LGTSNKDYNFSLFKPVTEYGKKNRNLIITLVVIWAVAIFGFQGLLVIFEKPTPEQSLITFESVWENVKTDNASITEKQDFINSLVLTTGKASLKPADDSLVNKALTYYVNSMLTEEEQVQLSEQLVQLSSTREQLTTAIDEEYINLQADLISIKADINAIANEKTGVDSMNLKETILPYNLYAENAALTDEEMAALPETMKLYLTHNQSFLTDTKFLGFPFHYFYSSEFLLILFVLLCLVYSMMITRLQKKYNIKEEE
jgi:hypothetical protein